MFPSGRFGGANTRKAVHGGVRSRVRAVSIRPVDQIAMLRAATDADPRLTILSVDAIGAYDHILRSAMLGRLMPGARQILLFVRLSHAQPSTYGWFDEDGQRRAGSQAEGGEQGDPLMPLLFSHWKTECIGGGGPLTGTRRAVVCFSRRHLTALPTIWSATPPQSVD